MMETITPEHARLRRCSRRGHRLSRFCGCDGAGRALGKNILELEHDAGLDDVDVGVEAGGGAPYVGVAVT